MEDLTKSQLVLLALLVSFVTSIATGIFTVTLLNEAPPAVTNTISRVVERTVEVMVPNNDTDDEITKETIVTKETTVVVNEEDLITKTLAQNRTKLVRIYQLQDEPTIVSSNPTDEILKNNDEQTNDKKEEKFVALGVIVSNGGLIVTDATVLDSGGRYILINADDTKTSAEIALVSDNADIALLKARKELFTKDTDINAGININTNANSNPRALTAIVFANQQAFKLGQSILALGGILRDKVTLGIISGFIEQDIVTELASSTQHTKADDAVAPTTKKTELIAIETTIQNGFILPGTPIFNKLGELLAIAVVGTDKTVAPKFIPNEEIKNLLTLYEEAPQPKKP